MTKFVFAPKSVQVTATTTSLAVGVPVEDGLLNCAREVLISASAEVYVKLATSGSVAATTNDILIQPGDSLRLQTSNCAFISVITASGTSRVTINGVSNGIGASCNTLNLNFLSDTLDPSITFTRASSGTHFDSTGRLVTDGNNVARFDYDPVTLQPRGLLIEESRTNLLLHSRDMTNAAWIKTDTTVARTQVGIDGAANTACLMTQGSAGTGYVAQTVAHTNTNIYTASFVFKRGNNDWQVVNFFDNTSFQTGRAWFNLNTGAKGATATSGGATNVSSTITALGGGWYRCTLTAQAPTGGANCTSETYSVTADSSTTRVNNATYIVDCAQLEVGSSASSIIHTGAATATRAADNARMTGTNFSGWFNAAAGTFFAEFDYGRTTGDPRIVGSATGSITPLSIAANLGKGQSFDTSAAIQTANTVPVNTVAKISSTWTAGIGYVCLNGGAVASGAQATGFSGMTNIALGADNSTNYINGHIRSIRYYSTRLPNATLQALTT